MVLVLLPLRLLITDDIGRDDDDDDDDDDSADDDGSADDDDDADGYDDETGWWTTGASAAALPRSLMAILPALETSAVVSVSLSRSLS